MVHRLILVLIAVLLAGLSPVMAQEQPDVPCFWRPTTLDKPWMALAQACIEEVIAPSDGGELAFTALAPAPDGTLYAARPLTGEVYLLRDGDGDGLPETPALAYDGLTRPNALAWYDGVLYAAGDANVYALRDGAITTLVDDLPSGPGLWTGGIVVGAVDGGLPRIYVGTGAACDACAGEAGRGAVWSFGLDGEDARLEATGLRQPADLAIHAGALWVLDSAAASRIDEPDLDEINRLQPGANFGFPACVGFDSEAACAGTTPPAVALPTGSTPLGLAAYTSDVIPELTGALLVAMAGSTGIYDLRGYMLAVVRPDDAESLTVVIPQSPDPLSPVSSDELNYRTVGFYPARLHDVAVTELGWVYISLSGGRILALRPQAENVY